MPAGAVYVGRPTKWGNPFSVSEYGQELAVKKFEQYAKGIAPGAIEELRGKDPACWCPLDKPCHADVLLRIANE